MTRAGQHRAGNPPGEIAAGHGIGQLKQDHPVKLRFDLVGHLRRQRGFANTAGTYQRDKARLKQGPTDVSDVIDPADDRTGRVPES